jgi:hypothetical protein
MTATATPGRLRRAIHRSPARPAALAAAGLLALTGSAFPPAAAAVPIEASVGALAGTVALDPHLADYRWETGARAAWGGEARLHAGPGRAAVRAWRATTAQALGIPGDDRVLDVRLTVAELAAEWPLVPVAGFTFATTASAGLLHVGYSPDALTLADGGGGRVAVDFAPITEPTWGVGLGVHRPLGSRFIASASVDRSWFRLDTSHRDGGAIVAARETFGRWMARITLTHRIWGGAR